jgi:predicted transposase YbfD/YdcC
VFENDETSDETLFGCAIWKYFANIHDPRVTDNQRYKFDEILFMIVCAIICGCDDVKTIVNYIEAKIEWFSKKLNIIKAPSYKTIWWVLVLIDPEEFNGAFKDLVSDMREVFCPSDSRELEIIAVDGKTSCGTKRSNIKAIHTVSAWSSSCQFLLGQVKTDKKSNEITAIPKLLKMLDLNNTIVTIDAAGCQTKIADQIINEEGNYIFALKGNQETIHEAVKSLFKELENGDNKNVDYSLLQLDMANECDKGHGRIEDRTVRVCYNMDWLKQERWKTIKSVIEIISKRTIKGKSTIEKRYYIASIKGSAVQFLKWIRSHWGVESFHWILDVSFKDDTFRGYTGNLAQNIGLLKRLTLNLLKQDNSKKTSYRQKRKVAGWNENYLLKLLGA